MDIANIVNGINDWSRTIGALSGAVDTLAPAAMAVNNTLNSVASTLTGTDTYNPYGYYPQQQYPVPTQNVLPTSSNANSVLGFVGKAVAGGVTGYMYSETSSNIIHSGAGTGAIAKGMGTVGLKSAGIGALIGGGVSVIENTVKAVKKEQSGAQAGGNIAADLLGGAVSGAVGGTLGGLAGSKFGGIGGAVVGVAAGLGIEFLYQQSGLKQNLANGVAKLFGGTTQTYTNYPVNTGYGYQQGYPTGYPTGYQTGYGYTR